MNCYKHRLEAEFQCVSCSRAWCSACVVEPEGMARVTLCPECRDMARPLVSRSGEPSFLADLVAAARYPMAGEGAFIVFGGAIFFGLLDLLAAYAWVFGIIAVVISTGYALLYYSSVVSASSDGDDELPGWPEFHNFSDDIFSPIFRAVGVAVISLAPAGIALAMELPQLSVVLGAAGMLFYMPMAWMAVSIHQSIMAANPVTVFDAIVRAPLHAAVASVAFFATIAGTVAFQEVAGGSFLGLCVSYVFGLYGMLVAMRVLGLFYYHNRERLNWFGEANRIAF